MREKNKEYKKETGCLFHNFEENKKEVPFLTHIKLKNKEMNNIYSNIKKYYKKISLTEEDQSELFKQILSKNMDKNKKTSIKIKKKKNNNSQLNSKIYFGSFINNPRSEKIDIVHKYENLKEKIFKSSNFSLIKDPNKIRFKELSVDLNLSTGADKNLVNYKLKNKKIKNEKESLIRLSYDNGIFDNNISNFQRNVDKIKNSQIFYINKNNIINNNNSFNINEKISESNLNKTKIIIQEEDNNDFLEKSIKKKYYFKKNLSDLNDINTKTNKISIINHQNIYNKTEHNKFQRNKKNPLLFELDNNIKNIIRAKTAKNSIKKFSKYFKQKSFEKIKKIDKLLNQMNLKTEKNLVVNALKDKNDRKNKNITKLMYIKIKKRLRLLSVVEKLKNIKRNAPLKILDHLYENYSEKSKDIILLNSFKKKINNIYKSTEEGQLIKNKINTNNYIINKLISKNQKEVNILKNRYEKFNLVIERINDENKGIIYSQTE